MSGRIMIDVLHQYYTYSDGKREKYLLETVVLNKASDVMGKESF